MSDDDLLSIIIPTIGRPAQLDALLLSIVRSSYKNHETIIVDQNRTGIADEVIGRYHDLLSVRQVKVDFTGAARARNHGLPYAHGQYLFFPDDDAELFPDTLSMAMKFFNKTGASVLFGRCVDWTMADAVGVFCKHSGFLSLKRYDDMSIETTMFIKKHIFEQFLFDESFGVGTFYGSEEGQDIVLRMLHKNVKMYYTPEVKIYHPQAVINHSDGKSIRRAFTYKCGFAHLCAKHKLYKKYSSRLLKVILYLPYTVFFARNKTRYYLSELMGLLTGMIVR